MECLRKHQSALPVTKNGVIEKLVVLIQTVCHLLLKFFHVFSLLYFPRLQLRQRLLQGLDQNADLTSDPS